MQANDGSNEDDDDNVDLNQFLGDGDDFLPEEERQEQEARERRLARKRRLQALGDASIGTEVTTAPSSTAEPPPAEHDSKSRRVDEKDTHLDTMVKANGTIETPVVDTTADPKTRDDFDMFSSSISPTSTKGPLALEFSESNGNYNNNKKKVNQQQDWDDVEGYYRATIGEIIQLDFPNASSDVRFRIAGVIGKGVFSTVLKCVTESSNLSSPLLPPQVALKMIRHNDTMAKAAVNEVRFLQRLTSAKSPGIISLLLPNDTAPLEHRGHTILVFPYMEYNLRDVLGKFGKGVGLSLLAVRSYFAQLLAAGWQLKQHKIIHSDLKPDNILVSADFQTICLADFGSAVDINEGVEVAPYLVSRFYRAPEIILGLSPTHAIDLWSLAVTAAELFLGKILFQGASNNDMLHVMMEHLGPCSNRVIRQHMVQTRRYPIPSHFSDQIPYVFRKLSEDPVSHKPVYKNVFLQEYTPTLQSKLLKAKSAKDSRAKVLQFSDLLQKCLTMDPSKRIDCKAALQHPFFKDETT